MCLLGRWQPRVICLVSLYSPVTQITEDNSAIEADCLCTLRVIEAGLAKAACIGIYTYVFLY